MNLDLSPRLAPLLLSLLLAACSSGGDDDDDGGCADLVPGDLVLTEVQANPSGEDSGNEWFELYDAASTAADLTGIELVVRKVGDASTEKTHAITDLVVQPDEYVVLGDVLPELKPSWVDYGFGNDLGSLVNGGGEIVVRCGTVEIDAFAYPEAEDGASTVLDGAIAPDHMANDDEDNLCTSTGESSVAPGVIGSPGEANEACNVVVPGTCLDGGTPREPVSPGPGDLVISEIMPNPATPIDDADGEWFEVYVGATVDLNGVNAGAVAGTPKAVVESDDCVTVAAGSYVIFAKDGDGAVNGGLPEPVATFTLNMGNSSGTLFVGVGDQVLDEIAWSSSEDGASTALASDQLDPTANDDEGNWVSCEAPYGDSGNLGTPGSANDTCSTPANQCNDGGTFRPIVSPTAGQLRVSELLANPSNDSPDTSVDPQHEWLELSAEASFDLNGLELVANGTIKQTLTSVDCLEVNDGDFVLLAHGNTGNGGLPTPDFIKTFGLTNSAGTLSLSIAGTEIDSLTYPTPTDGSSFQLDPDGATTCVTPFDIPYGGAMEHNLGTPGDANPDCPP